MKFSTKRCASLVLALASALTLSACGTENLPGHRGGRSPHGNYLTGGCAPMNTQIPFSGTNIHFDWSMFQGGLIPNGGQQIGQMAVGGGYGGYGTGGQYQRSGVDGTISMSVMQVGANNPYNTGTTNPYTNPYAGYPTTQPTNSLANVHGFIQVSSTTQQDILYRVQSGQIPVGNINGGVQTGYPTYNPYNPYPNSGYPNTGYPNTGYNPMQMLCVSGIAMSGKHYNNTIYDANVYLYFNNTQHGYALYF